MPRMRWGAMVGVVMAMMVVPAGAMAEKPTGTVPSRVALKGLGLEVAWPAARGNAMATAGGTLTVRVVRARRSTAVADVEFGRVSVNGRMIELLQRKRFKTGGTLKVAVPAALGRHYALSLRAGRRTYRTWFEVPTPTPRPLSSCLTPGTATATLTLAPTLLHPGDPFNYTISNTGTGCLSTGQGYTFYLQTGTGWERIPNPQAFTAEGLIVKPGGVLNLRGSVQTDLQPGHYRLATSVDGMPASPSTAAIPVVTDVDVAAASAPAPAG
jgi:hypothetical protein